jgi:hypothetical protein
LLNGKGEIKDVELNCALLNQELLNITPYIQLDRIQISRLSFHVDSWTNLRKAPIHVDIEHITAQLSEPFHYVELAAGHGGGGAGGDRKALRQVTAAELAELIRRNIIPPPRTASYNLLDRILDNLSIEIKSLSITFQPSGKFKTRCVGPWTPPAIQISLQHLKWCSVNEFGQEDTVDNVWRHNEQQQQIQQQNQVPRRTTRRNNNNPNDPNNNNNASFLICKKFECHYQVSLVANGGTFVVPIVSCNAATAQRRSKLEVQVAIRRRIRDGAVLAVQLDASLPVVDVEIAATTVPLLAHLLAALQYCLAKDRAFSDPLKASATAAAGGVLSNAAGKLGLPQPQTKSDEDGASLNESSSAGAAEVMVLEELTSTAPELLAAALEEQEESFSDGSGSKDPDEIVVVTSATDENDMAEDDDDEDDDATRTSSSQPQQGQQQQQQQEQRQQQQQQLDDTRSVLITPSGTIIYEKVAVSMTILHLDVRCWYAASSVDDNGDDDNITDGGNSNSSMIVSANGLVAELIWPKVTKVRYAGDNVATLMFCLTHFIFVSLLNIRKRDAIYRRRCRSCQFKKCGMGARGNSWSAGRNMTGPVPWKRSHRRCAKCRATNPFHSLKIDWSDPIRCICVRAFPSKRLGARLQWAS